MSNYGDNPFINQSIEDKLESFVNARFLPLDVEEYLLSRTKHYNKTFYRGLPFPMHLIKEGLVIENWHGASHWSVQKDIALDFAIEERSGYVNEEYRDELIQEYGEDNVHFVPLLMICRGGNFIPICELIKADSKFRREQEYCNIGDDFRVVKIRTEIIYNKNIIIVEVDQIKRGDK